MISCFDFRRAFHEHAVAENCASQPNSGGLTVIAAVTRAQLRLPSGCSQSHGRSVCADGPGVTSASSPNLSTTLFMADFMHEEGDVSPLAGEHAERPGFVRFDVEARDSLVARRGFVGYPQRLHAVDAVVGEAVVLVAVSDEVIEAVAVDDRHGREQVSSPGASFHRFLRTSVLK